MILLKKGRYCYIPEMNMLANREFADLFYQDGNSGSFELDEFHIDRQQQESNVRRIHHVIFETTRACNLNCLYCSYNGNYKYHRVHSSERLTLTTARKGIDYLYKLFGNRNKKKINFGFYGGEPLLEFETIKKIVDHALIRFAGWDVSFNITTNAVHLTNEMIEFLISHKFDMTVSLDGPKKNHDAKRKLKNGSGTFDAVMDNLSGIKTRDNLFYTESLSFNITYSHDLPLGDTIDFFTSNDLVNKNNVMFTRVNPIDTCYYQKYPYDDGELKDAHAQIFKRIKEKKKAKEELFPIEDAFLKDVSGLEGMLKVKKLDTKASTCTFNGRLYIDVTGRFHVCEKMNDKFPIGDVHSGFDYIAMEKMTEDFCQLIKTTCKTCEVQYLCQRCFAHFAGDGEFQIDPWFCENSKNVVHPLERLIELKEETEK